MHSQWTINAKIFEDGQINPDPHATDPAPDNLNFDFIKRVNDLCLDVCKLIISLRPGVPDSWQYESIEQFRNYIKLE